MSDTDVAIDIENIDVVFTGEGAEAIREIMRIKSLCEVDAIASALGTYVSLLNEQRAGHKVLVKRRWKTVEVLL